MCKSLDMRYICGGRKKLKKVDIGGVTTIEGLLTVESWLFIVIM